MARIRKNTVDHFLHDCKLGQTIFIIEQRWGNDGYTFWFKLLELLGDTENHFIDAAKPEVWEFLTAKTRTSDQTATDILDMLAKLDAIDADLWACKIVWSQKFVDRLVEVYRKRTTKIPPKPDIRAGYPTGQDESAPVIPLLREEKCTKEKGSEEPPCRAAPDLVEEIFAYWQTELKHPQSKLDKERKKAIKSRLAEGYAVDRIKQAIRGIKKCPHNMGQNDRNTKFDDIELICRSGANVDRFADAESAEPRFAGQERYENALLTKGGP